MVRTAKSAPYLGNVGLGHSRIQSTARYAHLDDRLVLKASDQIGRMLENFL